MFVVFWRRRNANGMERAFYEYYFFRGSAACSVRWPLAHRKNIHSASQQCDEDGNYHVLRSTPALANRPGRKVFVGQYQAVPCAVFACVSFAHFAWFAWFAWLMCFVYVVCAFCGLFLFVYVRVCCVRARVYVCALLLCVCVRVLSQRVWAVCGLCVCVCRRYALCVVRCGAHEACSHRLRANILSCLKGTHAFVAVVITTFFNNDSMIPTTNDAYDTYCIGNRRGNFRRSSMPLQRCDCMKRRQLRRSS